MTDRPVLPEPPALPPPPPPPPPGASSPSGNDPYAPWSTPPAQRKAPVVVLSVAIAAAFALLVALVVVAVPQAQRRQRPVAAHTSAHPSTPTAGTTATPSPTTTTASPLDVSGTTVAEVLPKLEAFVERTRAHRFSRPVQVTVLDGPAFLAELHATDGTVSSQADTATQSTLIALHLVPTTFNYAAAESTAQDDSVGGFYQDGTNRLYVRSGKLTALAKVIIVHELTHALDDQLFGLKKVHDAAHDGESDLAGSALIEGDARWVEDKFRDALSADDRLEADNEEHAFGAGHAPPDALLTMDEFPYDVGETFIDELVKNGGTTAIDHAFVHPPVTTLQVMDPGLTFIGDSRDDGEDVARPAYSGTKLDADRLGSFGLALMLSDGDPSKFFDADAPDMWEGDSYVTYRSGGQTCLRDHLLVDDPSDEADMVSSLRDWASSHPVTTVRTIDDDEVEFTTCAGA